MEDSLILSDKKRLMKTIGHIIKKFLLDLVHG